MSQLNPPSTPPLSNVATTKARQPFYKRKTFIAFLALPFLWIIGTLLPQDAETKTDSGNSSVASSPSANVQCIAIPSLVLADIASGEESGVGMTPIAGYAVKSPDYSNVYFLAIQFSASGIDDQVGVWARNGIDTGIIMSVDSIAQNFTVWPDADGTDAAIATTDPSVSSAKSCL
jgi:hypothetical protein